MHTAPQVDPLQQILSKITLIKGDKGDRGERGFIGEIGPKGDSIVGPKGDPGRDGTDGKNGKDSTIPGPRGERGSDGKDGNANIVEVIDIAQSEIKAHEKSFDHASIHDPFTVGSMVIDEKDIGEGKIPVIQGKKLVYKPLPKGQERQIHGGGISRIRKNSTGDGFSKSRLNFIEGSNITITMATDDDKAETDITIASTGGSSVNFADKEIPTGTIDGVNVTFTLAHTPTAGSELLFRNGVLQNVTGGSDYGIASAIITFTSAPGVGDVLLCSYRF